MAPESIANSGDEERMRGERILDCTPFTLEYEDDTATHGITALVQGQHGIYLVVDYPLEGECPGERMVVKVSHSYEEAARFWTNLTDQPAPKVGEAV